MKWETYKQLTPKQKEEYDFKFKTGYKLRFDYLTIILLFLVSTNMILAAGVIKVMPEMSEYLDMIKSMLVNAANILKLSTTVYIIDIVTMLAAFTYNKYKEYKLVRQWQIQK